MFGPMKKTAESTLPAVIRISLSGLVEYDINHMLAKVAFYAAHELLNEDQLRSIVSEEDQIRVKLTKEDHLKIIDVMYYDAKVGFLPLESGRSSLPLVVMEMTQKGKKLEPKGELYPPEFADRVLEWYDYLLALRADWENETGAFAPNASQQNAVVPPVPEETGAKQATAPTAPTSGGASNTIHKIEIEIEPYVMPGPVVEWLKSGETDSDGKLKSNIRALGNHGHQTGLCIDIRNHLENYHKYVVRTEKALQKATSVRITDMKQLEAKFAKSVSRIEEVVSELARDEEDRYKKLRDSCMSLGLSEEETNAIIEQAKQKIVQTSAPAPTAPTPAVSAPAAQTAPAPTVPAPTPQVAPATPAPATPVIPVSTIPSPPAPPTASQAPTQTPATPVAPTSSPAPQASPAPVSNPTPDPANPAPTRFILDATTVVTLLVAQGVQRTDIPHEVLTASQNQQKIDCTVLNAILQQNGVCDGNGNIAQVTAVV